MTEALNHANARSDNQHWIVDFDAWKFVGALFVAGVHSQNFFGGSVRFRSGGFAVEYFFLLTGFLFARSVLRDERVFSAQTAGRDAWRFVWRKFKPILPFYLVGFACTFFLSRGIGWIRPGNFVQGVFGALLLHERGFGIHVQGINWYLANMFAVMVIAHPFFRWKKDLFAEWFCPIAGVFLLGALFHECGSLAPGFQTWWGPVNAYLFRAAGEIFLGVAAFRISKAISAGHFGRLQRIALEWAAFLTPMSAFTLLAHGIPRHYQPFIVLLFFVFIVLSGAGFGPVGRFPWKHWHKICRGGGRLSMALFLLHSPVSIGLATLSQRVKWMNDLFSARDPLSVWLSLGMYFALSLLLTAVCLALFRPHTPPTYTKSL